MNYSTIVLRVGVLLVVAVVALHLTACDQAPTPDTLSGTWSYSGRDSLVFNTVNAVELEPCERTRRITFNTDFSGNYLHGIPCPGASGDLLEFKYLITDQNRITLPETQTISDFPTEFRLTWEDDDTWYYRDTAEVGGVQIVWTHYWSLDS